MQFQRSDVSDFLLSPMQRKQRQDLQSAIATLQDAIKELQARADSNQLSLRCRDVISNSNRAISVIKTYVSQQFDPTN